MTTNRPTACTVPPWQHILDRKAAEREALAQPIHLQAGESRLGIAKCSVCYREFKQIEQETVCPRCRTDYIDPIKTPRKED